MKTILLLLLMTPLILPAQDTATIEQYCEVTIEPRLFSSKFTIKVEYGDELRNYTAKKGLPQDPDESSIFNTRVDALNYMGRLGWTLVQTMPRDGSNWPVFLLKKRVPRSILYTAR